MGEFVSFEFNFMNVRKRLRLAWEVLRHGSATIVISSEELEESIVKMHEAETVEVKDEDEYLRHAELIRRSRAAR